jgi:hypothetical protein
MVGVARSRLRHTMLPEAASAALAGSNRITLWFVATPGVNGDTEPTKFPTRRHGGKVSVYTPSAVSATETPVVVSAATMVCAPPATVRNWQRM